MTHPIREEGVDILAKRASLFGAESTLESVGWGGGGGQKLKKGSAEGTVSAKREGAGVRRRACARVAGVRHKSPRIQ